MIDALPIVSRSQCSDVDSPLSFSGLRVLTSPPPPAP